MTARSVRRGTGRWQWLAALALVAASCGNGADPASPPVTTRSPGFRVLVFSRTAAFRHESIPAGIGAMRELGAEAGFAVDATEDAGVFTDAGLDGYDVIVWLSTTGDVLDDAQQAAFERWARAGGGFAGVHAAADTEYDWPFYGDLLGARFSHHPEPGPATLVVEDGRHPSTAHLGPTWTRFDEWYAFRASPRGPAHVLVSLSGSAGDGDRPLVWCSVSGRGRSWYTALGHTEASFSEPAFRQHLLGGIRSVAGGPDQACG